MIIIIMIMIKIKIMMMMMIMIMIMIMMMMMMIMMIMMIYILIYILIHLLIYIDLSLSKYIYIYINGHLWDNPAKRDLAPPQGRRFATGPGDVADRLGPQGQRPLATSWETPGDWEPIYGYWYGTIYGESMVNLWIIMVNNWNNNGIIYIYISDG